MGMELFVAALLVLLAKADGLMADSAEGNHPLSKGAMSFYDVMASFENMFSSQGDVPPDFFCHSCQKVSKKVEKFLSDPSLYEEVDTLSTEVCHILHPDLQRKCRKLVELYLREGILFLQILFLEKNICNNTGFCLIDNSTSSLSISNDNEVRPPLTSSFVLLRKIEKQSSMDLASMNKINLSPFKVIEGKRCDSCHVATEKIRKGLEDHERQIKIIKTLLDACELAQSYANKCKRLIFQYGPLGLANLQKFLSSTDFCHIIHLCEESKPPKGKTTKD